MAIKMVLVNIRIFVRSLSFISFYLNITEWHARISQRKFHWFILTSPGSKFKLSWFRCQSNYIRMSWLTTNTMLKQIT